MYVGQTRSHILNHGKYRPFGASKRWAQHVSEANADMPARQSWKLNNAIRKYGASNFEVEVLGDCDLDVLDRFERLFIETHDTVRRGYNIQKGGRSGAKNSEESASLTAATLKTFNDRVRLTKFQDVDAAQVRLIRLGDKGVRAYVVDHTGSRTYTSFYGRRSTLGDSAARALQFARALLNNDDSKLHVPESLSDFIQLNS